LTAASCFEGLLGALKDRLAKVTRPGAIGFAASPGVGRSAILAREALERASAAAVAIA
jgi:hypothetical protein